jgi:hypothetical protein
MQPLRRIILFVVAMLVGGAVTLFAFAARAGVACSLPFTLTNGTIADASQVMANYNALVTCLTNAAAAGSNNDITSLSGLLTPITPVQGGSNTYIGSSVTASGAQIIIGATSPANYTNTAGYTVIFAPAATSTNANATMSVAGQPVRALLKRAAGGFTQLSQGDLNPYQLYAATYDGTQFEVFSTSFLLYANFTDQLLTGGANVVSVNLGTFSTGTQTIDCGKGPLQFFTNGGAFTLGAPSTDGSCIVASGNSGSAGTISFSGFSVGANTGDALDNSNGHNFMINIVRISGVSTYTIKALQ